jgi:FkbM family methyltransferase
VDCGAHFGVDHVPWQHLGQRLVMHGFEAFADECARQNQRARAAGLAHYYHPVCLAESQSAGRPFYVTRSADSSSLYRPAEYRLRRWRHSVRPPEQVSSLDMNGLARVVPVNTTTLDAWAAGNGDPDVDFLKLDLQGGELAALQGGTKLLQRVLGIELQVFFVQQYENQPLFAEVDQFLRQAGFSFFNILFTHTGHFAGRVASPVSVRYADSSQLRAQGAGQLVTANASYLFDPLDQVQPSPGRSNLDKLLKLVIIAEAYGQVEFAFEVLAWIRNESAGTRPALLPALDQVIAIAAGQYKSN